MAHPRDTLEIQYSMNAKESDHLPLYPVQIDLGLIDQAHANPTINANRNRNGSQSTRTGAATPNGSFDEDYFDIPYTPREPETPGGSTDVSKKQRHNLREQRRILRISHQFDKLRKRLENAGFGSTKKDKFSVLQATLEYIGSLERNARLPPTQGKESFLIDSMPSPVPSLSAPGATMTYPMGSPIYTPTTPSFPTAEVVEESSSTFKNVFFQASMPCVLAKLDGTIVEANNLFLQLSNARHDELRLHSLYTMCTAQDAPKMQGLVRKILNGELGSAQAKLMWHFSSGVDRKVFVSVSLIRDNAMQPANIHCSLLPLS